MASSFICTHEGIPRDSVRLGRLLMDCRYPKDYLYDSDSASNVEQIVSEHDFRTFASHGRGEGIVARMFRYIHVAFSRRRGKVTEVEPRLVKFYEFVNFRDYFLDIMQEEKTRKWIEKAIVESGKGRIAYIVGFLTFTDAKIKERDTEFKSTDAGANIPVGEIAAAATGNPASVIGDVLDVGVELNAELTGDITSELLSRGELVYAIEYKKVNISYFKLQDIHLAPGKSHWQTFKRLRGNDNGSEADIIVADISESEEFELEDKDKDKDENEDEDEDEDEDDEDDASAWKWTKVNEVRYQGPPYFYTQAVGRRSEDL